MTPQSVSRIDALYEAAKKATPGPRAALHIDHSYEEFGWERPDGTLVEVSAEDLGLMERADRETVMALVEAYRAAKKIDADDYARLGMPVRHDRALRAAIEKVEALR